MRISCIAAAFFLVFAVGCSKPYQANAFDGPDRAGNEVARLFLDPQVRFVSVDGKPLANFPGEWDSAGNESINPRIVRLLPGTHRVVVGMNPETLEGNPAPAPGPAGGGVSVTWGFTYSKHYPGSQHDEQLEFTAEAGRKYMLKIKNPLDLFTKEEKWSAIIYDSDSSEFQKVVSRSYGRTPHQFPPPQK